MSQFSSEWLFAREARMGKKQTVAKSGCDKESELHEKIFAECRRRGWIALHGAMSERTHRTAGEPDFTILLNGLVLFIECKTRIGKLSSAQVAMIHHAKRLGHTIHVVRSFEEFLKLL